MNQSGSNLILSVYPHIRLLSTYLHLDPYICVKEQLYDTIYTHTHIYT